MFSIPRNNLNLNNKNAEAASQSVQVSPVYLYYPCHVYKVRPRVDSKSTLGFVRYIVFYLPRCEVFFFTRRRDVANWTNCTSHTTTGQTTAIYLDKNVQDKLRHVTTQIAFFATLFGVQSNGYLSTVNLFRIWTILIYTFPK